MTDKCADPAAVDAALVRIEQRRATRVVCTQADTDTYTLAAAVRSERIENAHLREAFVAMERAANQHESALAALEADNTALLAEVKARVKQLQEQTRIDTEVIRQWKAERDALRAELTAAQQLAFSQGIELGALRDDLAIAQQQARDYSCRVGQLEREQTRLQADLAEDEAIVEKARAICHARGYRVDADHEGWTGCALRCLDADLARARAVLDTATEIGRALDVPGRCAIDIDDAAWQAWTEGQQ